MKVSRDGGRWVQDNYPIPNSLDENVMSYYLSRKPLVPRRSEGSKESGEFLGTCLIK